MPTTNTTGTASPRTLVEIGALTIDGARAAGTITGNVTYRHDIPYIGDTYWSMEPAAFERLRVSIRSAIAARSLSRP